MLEISLSSSGRRNGKLENVFCPGGILQFNFQKRSDSEKLLWFCSILYDQISYSFLQVPLQGTASSSLHHFSWPHAQAMFQGEEKCLSVCLFVLKMGVSCSRGWLWTGCVAAAGLESSCLCHFSAAIIGNSSLHLAFDSFLVGLSESLFLPNALTLRLYLMFASLWIMFTVILFPYVYWLLSIFTFNVCLFLSGQVTLNSMQQHLLL